MSKVSAVARQFLTRRGVVRFGALLAVLASSSTLSMVPAASASAATFGQFSPFVPPNTGYVGDCTVLVGPVFDTSNQATYRKIGGVSVNCNSEHSVIKATVWQQWSAGGSSTVYNVGTSTVATPLYNSYGSGSGVGGILRSGAVCGHGWYRTAALVQTNQAGRYLYSQWADTTGGC